MNCNNFTETKLSIFASPASYASKLVPMQEILRLTQYDNILRERTCQYRETMHAMGKKTANKHVKEKLVYAFSVAVWDMVVNRLRPGRDWLCATSTRWRILPSWKPRSLDCPKTPMW